MKISNFTFLFYLFVFSFMNVHAQVSKTITVSSPGTLGTQMTWQETYIITNLTVSGKLDARDFKCMNENLPVLETVDLSACTISGYYGSDGPTWSSTLYYPENELPQNAFCSTITNTGIKYVYGKKTLKSVILPSNITSIGTDAFNECTSMTFVKLPATLQTIKESAFRNCTSLITIQNLAAVPPTCFTDALTGVNATTCEMTLPTNSLSAYQNALNWKDFKQKAGGYTVSLLTNHGTTGSVTGLQYRFYTKNESITLVSKTINPETTVSWSENGNLLSTGGTYTFTITDDRKLLLNFERIENQNITKAATLSTYLTDVKTITQLNVSGNIDARDIKFIRDSLTALTNLDLSHSTINGCYGAGSDPSVNLYNDNELPSSSFFSYTNSYLTSIKLPANLQRIGNRAFSSCRNLKDITLPASLNNIQEYAFMDCISLKTITNYSIYPIVIDPNIFTRDTPSNVDLIVPVNTASAYTTAPVWGGLHIITGGYSVSAKSNNELTGSISGIENRFYNSNEAVILIASPRNGSTFKNWSENGIVISNNPEIDLTITDNRQLTATFGLSATVKQTVAGKLKNGITHPASVSELTISGNLDARDFQFIRDSIPALETLDISDTHIMPYSGYVDANSNTSYPENQLPKYAFSAATYPCLGMKFLKTVILPLGLTSIGERAFYNGISIENVNMPFSLTSIATNAFVNCSNLKTLTLPPNLSSVDYTAFQNCTRLKTLNNFSLHPIAINSYVFDGITPANCSLLVPTGTLSVYKGADVWKNFNVSEGGYVVTAVSNELTTGTVSGTENRFYALNESVTTQCTPLNGTTFKNWTEQGKPVSTESTYTFNVSANRCLTANFSKDATIQTDVAGTLKDKVTGGNSITRLTLSGTIDARDIKYLRDSLPALEDLDLSACKIVAFTGMATVWESRNFYVNTLPMNSFYNSTTALGKSSLKSIILPDSLTVIDMESFRGCSKLDSIKFPKKLTTIYDAFSYCTSLTSIVIPSTVTTLSGSFIGCTRLTTVILPENLKFIDQESFKGCLSLKRIHIPEGVTDIRNSAFEGCTSLEKLKLPNALTIIYYNAFKNCTSLDSLQLPAKLATIDISAFDGCAGIQEIGFQSALPTIGDNAFANCSGIKKLIFPRKLKSIGSNAFQNCTSITKIVLPDDLISLGDGAFGHCPGITEVTIPNKIVNLGTAFSYCTGLKKITLQTGLKNISGNAFAGCTGLTSISIPSGVTYIGGAAFEGCTSLMNVSLPAGLTNMGNNTFGSCTSLKSLIFPVGFTTLTGMTFTKCTSLVSVTLPVELSSMFMIEFDGCTQLSEIINLNPVPLPNSSLANTFIGMDQSKVRLTVQSSSINAYKAAVPWKNFNIQDGGYTIIASPSNSMIGEVNGANRFYQPNETANLEAISKLGSTFVNWTENGTIVSTNPVLTFTVSANRKLIANFIRELTIDIAESGSLRDSVFDSNSVSKLTVNGVIDARDIKFMRDNMSSLTSIDLSNSTIAAYSGADGTADGFYEYAKNTMPNSSFMNNTLLKSIILSKELMSIDNQAFSGCAVMTQCVFTESISSIGNDAFYNCKGLGSLKLPAGLRIIGNRAFLGCTGLNSVQFPTGLLQIGQSAFSGCSGIMNLTLPDGLKILDYSAFSLCTGLTKVVFPKSLTVISMLSFSSCSNLINIELPEGITQISYGAFGACSGLQTITFPASLTFIGTSAFGSCTGLKEITLSSGLSVLAENAFYGCTRLTKITNPNSTPIEITSGVFSGVNQSGCSLIVPTGSESAFKSANVWKNFRISGSGYSVSALSNNPMVGIISGLTNKMYPLNEVVTLTAETIDGSTFINWTENNQEISTSPVYTFTVTGNRKLIANFENKVTISSQNAGNLKNALQNTLSITSLVLSGNIDARDIKYIRDNFPSLISLNLKGAHMKSYTGTSGTNQWVYSYPENEMPESSFNNPSTGIHNNINSIILPEDLDSIGRYAFTECSALKSIILPTNLKSIETWAFFGCTGLDSITLPAGLLIIQESSFAHCDSLKRITNLSIQPLNIGIDVFSNTTFSICKLIVPDESVLLYKSATIWKNFFQIIGISTFISTQTEESDVLLYPIPVMNLLTIKMNSSTKITSLKIFDLNGKIYWVSDGYKNQIDVSGLPKNTYFLQLDTSNKIIVRKFIKN